MSNTRPPEPPEEKDEDENAPQMSASAIAALLNTNKLAVKKMVITLVPSPPSRTQCQCDD